MFLNKHRQFVTKPGVNVAQTEKKMDDGAVCFL